ncbi:MAG: DMT family transporter [Bacillota bacterium]|nr:DMT family transporter [Bacillota bacterium]
MRDASGNSFYLALACIVLAVVFWGVSFISTKVVLRVLSPVGVAFLRQLIALLVLVPWAARSRALVRVTLRDAGLLALSGLFGIVFYFVCENTGLKYTTASNASMLVAALPVFTMVTESLFFGLRVTWAMVLCVAASVAGVYLLVTVNGRLDFSSARLLGNGLVLLAMGSWVVYTVLNRKLAKAYSSLTVVVYQTFAGALLFVPLIAGEARLLLAFREYPLPLLGHLIFLGVCCSAVSYFAYVYAVRRLGATVAAAFLNLIPVVTAAGGYLVLGERLAWLQVGGMALVMGAVYGLSRLSLDAQVPTGAGSLPA